MIAEAGFKATAEKLKAYTCLLALEDTTTLKFNHDTVCDEMGHTTSQKNSRGMHAHSVLFFAPKEQHVVGLIEQELWTRDVNSYGKSSQRATRPYKEKESFKWERASQTMESRLGNDMQKIISVCDREADLIEYLTYKTSCQQRFIVRSSQNRYIEQSEDRLYQYNQSLRSAGKRKVQITQKGGRKARKVTCDVYYASVTIKPPKKKHGKSISMFYIRCQERNNDQGLCWHIFDL